MKLVWQHIALIFAVLALYPMSPVSAVADLESGLVGYWNLDTVDIDWETKTVLDRSGNGNTGTLVGFSPSNLQPGKIGQALKFSGAETAITIPGTQSLNHRITNAYSLSIWLNLASAPNNWIYLFYEDADQHLGLRVLDDLTNLKSGIEVNSLTQYGTHIKRLGIWQHLVATFDGSHQVVYLDGSPISSNSTSGRAGGVSSLRIGAGFDGLLDEVRVYNRALTSDDVLALYKATSFSTSTPSKPAFPDDFSSPTHTSSSVQLTWTISDSNTRTTRIYRDDELIAELDKGVSSFNVKNLTPDTSYLFKISAMNSLEMEGDRSTALSVHTDALPVVEVTPAEYLASKTRPTFKSGNTLLPLTRYGWQLGYDTQVETANWGYALQFGTVNATTTGDLSNPTSLSAKLVALVKRNPALYRLSVIIPRIDDGITSTAYAVDVNGNPTTTWSPEAPDSVMSDLANTNAGYLSLVEAQAPVSIVLDNGERYLSVAGWAQTVLQEDPSIVAAKGAKTWPDYISERKAYQGMFFTDAVHSVTSAPYIWYEAGGNRWRKYRNSNWDMWDWDYKWMHTTTDYPDNEFYWTYGQNTGWIADGSGKDMLSMALNAYGYAITFDQPLTYNWLSSGWLRDGVVNNGFGDIERYYGFLKSIYTMGSLGGIAGYFVEPPGGFDISFYSDSPPNWLEQMEALGQVHAEFSYLEDFLRNGDLLEGPNTNEWNPDQPAYEFYSGHTNTRVLVRKLRDINRWLISVWAADGVVRTVPITIPILGNITVQAYPAGSLYYAQLVAGQPQITAMDLGSTTPSPLHLPNYSDNFSPPNPPTEIHLTAGG